MKTCILVGTSLKITSLLGVIVSLAGITDLEAFFLRSAASGTCIRGIYTRGTYTRSTYSGSTYIGAGICSRDAWIRDTSAADTRATWIKSAYFAKDACIKGVDICDICDSAYKPSKFSLGCSRLLAELTSEMFVRSCLHLRVILDKVLYCYFTYWIYSIVYLSFQLALTTFSIAVI